MTTDAPTIATGDLAARIDRLKLELHDAAVAFTARIAEAAPAADRLAHLEAALRAAENQAGLHDGRPPIRELAAEAVVGLLHGLSPYLRPLTTPESGQRAAEELLTR
jgi:hypothetical protein